MKLSAVDVLARSKRSYLELRMKLNTLNDFNDACPGILKLGNVDFPIQSQWMPQVKHVLRQHMLADLEKLKSELMLCGVDDFDN